MEKAIEEEVKLLNLNTVQIFTHGPRNRNKNKMDYENVVNICEESKLDLYTHGSYVSVGLWNIIKKPEDKEKNINHIVDMFKVYVEGQV